MNVLAERLLRGHRMQEAVIPDEELILALQHVLAVVQQRVLALHNGPVAVQEAEPAQLHRLALPRGLVAVREAEPAQLPRLALPRGLVAAQEAKPAQLLRLVAHLVVVQDQHLKLGPLQGSVDLH